jgi:hypothetical protein
VTDLEKEILETRRILIEADRRKREEKTKEKEKLKLSARPRGRPTLEARLIERAKKLAQTKPLSEVALILGITRTSLYKYGISRKSIDEERAKKVDPYKVFEEIREELLAKKEKKTY